VLVREGLWVVEAVIDYGDGRVFEVVVISELKDGKMWRERWYFAEPFEREAKPDTMTVTERDACAPAPSALCAGTLRVASWSRCRPVAPLLERTGLPTKST